MTILGLDHAQLAAPAGCEAAARRFYGERLGLEETPKPEGVRASGGVWFRCGAQEIHIGVEDDFRPARKAHPGLAVDGDAALDALVGRLVDEGIEVQWDTRIAGVRRCYVHDPWGNRVELVAR